MHLLECLQALERGVAEASTHETSIHAVVVVLFARWSLVFEVCGHALDLTRSGRPSSNRTSRPRRVVARAVVAAAQLTRDLGSSVHRGERRRLQSGNCSPDSDRQRAQVRAAARAVAERAACGARKQYQFGKTQPLDPPPRAAARLRGAASGVEGPGRAQRQRREHDRPCTDAHRKEHPKGALNSVFGASSRDRSSPNEPRARRENHTLSKADRVGNVNTSIDRDWLQRLRLHARGRRLPNSRSDNEWRDAEHRQPKTARARHPQQRLQRNLAQSSLGNHGPSLRGDGWG
jgi:hypothetical protein